MPSLIRTALLSLAVAAAALCSTASAQQQDGPAAAAAATSASASEPQAADTNAQRARVQPGNNAPFWRGVHDSGLKPGTVNNFAMGEPGVLIQPFVTYPGTRKASAGEAWRQIRNNWIIPYGGALLVIFVLAIGLYFFAKGPIGGHEPNTGRLVQRFTYFERAAHWVNAIAFSVLAISGLVLAFGKFSLLPLTGGLLFGWLSWVLKTAHNFAGPLFAVSLPIMFFAFLRSNWPNLADLKWLMKAGGLFGGKEPPSGRFNAGEKIVFWLGVFLLGSLVIGSGLVLDKLVPGLAYLRDDMQLAHIIHSVAAVFMMVVFLGHIYLGTIGMRGSYQAMKTGYVDEGWAREHHPLWLDDIRAGRVPADLGVPPAAARQPAV